MNSATNSATLMTAPNTPVELTAPLMTATIPDALTATPTTAALMDCPICMECIEPGKNCVTTDCGHVFHCSCLMQNAAHNGFGCPYCRTAMAEEPKDDDDEDDGWSDIEDDEMFDDDALTSFRMFSQRIEGEEVEEEDEDDDDDEEDDDDDDRVPPPRLMPSAAYVTEKLIQKGVTMEQLVKLWIADNYFLNDELDIREANQTYGKLRAIIAQHQPGNDM